MTTRIQHPPLPWGTTPNVRVRRSARLLLLMLVLLVLLPFSAPFVVVVVPQPRRTSSSSTPLLRLGPLVSRRSGSSSTLEDDGGPVLLAAVYDTIAAGQIAVVPQFLSATDITPLRHDAQHLFMDQQYSTDALAGYGSKGKFDPKKDRSVLKLPQWKNPQLGNAHLRHHQLGQLMHRVRTDLATNLQRPGLTHGIAASNRYGGALGSTEISYTRFGPGASLKKHVDEHHEEFKGVAGWSQPTRRSISWLLYLQAPDWIPARDGGQLHCYQRAVPPIVGTRVGCTTTGDVQIGWLTSRSSSTSSSSSSRGEIPVYLDAKNHDHGDCAMYYLELPHSQSPQLPTRIYITKPFKTNPIMYMAGSEKIVQHVLIQDTTVARRFRLIEPAKANFEAFLHQTKSNAQNKNNGEYELLDVDPYGGTLVLFDSVTLPHEVLPTTNNRERWACSGWYHEDQQPPPSSATTLAS